MLRCECGWLAEKLKAVQVGAVGCLAARARASTCACTP